MEQKKKRTLQLHKLGTAKNTVILLCCFTAIYLVIRIYFGLLSFNFMSSGFRRAIGFLLFVWSVPLLLKLWTGRKKKDKPKPKTVWYIPFYCFIVYFAVTLALELFSSPLFFSTNYRRLISVNDGYRFEDSVENYTTMQIPVVDRALAEKLGDHVDAPYTTYDRRV